jgi:hypothetical protein
VTAPVFAVSLAPPTWTAQLIDSNGETVSTIGQSVASLVNLRVVVHATVNGNAAYNPTADVVQFGFQNEATNLQSVAPSSWSTGSWETDVIGGLTVYVARILVGPGGTFVPSAATNYWLWVKVTDSPEIPVMFVGELRVT